MDFHRFHDQERNITRYTLEISDKDMAEVEFQSGDHLLFDEISNDENATISDSLLALELVARRIEETKDEHNSQ